MIAFFQLQAWVVWPDKPFLKSLTWLYFTSLFIAPLFFWSTKWSYEHFGAFWNFRLAGFGIGTIVFGLMAWSIFGEVPTLKNYYQFNVGYGNNTNTGDKHIMY